MEGQNKCKFNEQSEDRSQGVVTMADKGWSPLYAYKKGE